LIYEASLAMARPFASERKRTGSRAARPSWPCPADNQRWSLAGPRSRARGVGYAASGCGVCGSSQLHQRAWHKRVSFTDEHTLQALGVALTAARQAQRLAELDEEILTREVCAIAGARELLLLHLRRRKW
jgi:hypothetical protein